MEKAGMTSSRDEDEGALCLGEAALSDREGAGAEGTPTSAQYYMVPVQLTALAAARPPSLLWWCLHLKAAPQSPQTLERGLQPAGARGRPLPV